MRITFIATRKNLDPTERELYEMDLLNRALNAAAVQERWDAGKSVPGVGTFNAVTVSVNKL